MISIELVRAVKLFQGLPDKIQEELCRHIRLREFQKKEFLFHRGTAGDALFMLFSGRLQVISATDEGKEIGINFLEPGDYFGEIALIDGGMRSASVIAIENSTVGILPKPEALWLFQNVPIIAERIQRRLCATIRQEINYRSSMGVSKAFTRIYSVIFGNLQIPQQVTANKPPTLENLPSQQTIASMANVSRETVSRAIHVLIRQGIIGKDARRLIIKDPYVLVKLARGEITADQITVTRHTEPAVAAVPVTAPAALPAAPVQKAG